MIDRSDDEIRFSGVLDAESTIRPVTRGITIDIMSDDLDAIIIFWPVDDGEIFFDLVGRVPEDSKRSIYTFCRVESLVPPIKSISSVDLEIDPVDPIIICDIGTYRNLVGCVRRVGFSAIRSRYSYREASCSSSSARVSPYGSLERIISGVIFLDSIVASIRFDADEIPVIAI